MSQIFRTNPLKCVVRKVTDVKTRQAEKAYHYMLFGILLWTEYKAI